MNGRFGEFGLTRELKNFLGPYRSKGVALDRPDKKLFSSQTFFTVGRVRCRKPAVRTSVFRCNALHTRFLKYRLGLAACVSYGSHFSLPGNRHCVTIRRVRGYVRQALADVSGPSLRNPPKAAVMR